MDKELLKKRHVSRLNSLAEQSSEDKAFFMSAPDILVYFDHREKKPETEKTQKQAEFPNEPVDSWVLLAACIIFNIIMGYHFLCFGMYYVKITETFQTTKAAAGFINALHGSIGPLSGLLTSALLDKYGERKVAMVGACITTTGIFSSVFAPDVYYLYLTYGAITGIGVNCMMLCLSVSIQKHFTKHRSLATSLVYCGIPLGNLFSPMISNYFLDTYGLRGTLLLHSGVIMNTIILSVTFWPVKELKKTKKQQVPDLNRKSRGTPSGNRGICDFSLCKNFYFILFIMSAVLIRFNTGAFMDHTPSRTVYMGYDLKWAGFLMTVLCTTSLIARLIFSGVTVFYTNINSLVIFAMCGSVQGLTSCLVPLASSSYTLLVVCSIVFGAFQGLLIPMVMLSTVQLAGVTRFGKARALTNLFCAISNFTATPVTGWIFDVTQNYNLPFYISGTIALIGSAIAYLVSVVYYCRSSITNDKEDGRDIPNGKANDLRIRTFTC